jgi:cytochrome c
MTDPLNATGSPLLENVERFAICFGVDNSGTLGGDMQGKEIHWYPNPNPFPTGDDLNKMLQKTVAVKIQMVIASEPDEGKGTPAEALSVATSTSYTFCDPSKNYTSESDKRLRKRFSATATLRNKVANGYGPNGWLEAK